MMFCFFVWSFPFLSRIFHLHRDATISGEGLQILTYTGLSWSLSSEGPLPCHTYCDAGQPFKAISKDPVINVFMSKHLNF